MTCFNNIWQLFISLFWFAVVSSPGMVGGETNYIFMHLACQCFESENRLRNEEIKP